jgi:N-acetylmuramoyl-L-alanine amidase
MAQLPHSNGRRDRRHILRAVYEENRWITTGEVPSWRRLEEAVEIPRRRSGALWLMAVLGLSVVLTVFARQFTPSPEVPAPPPAAAVATPPATPDGFSLGQSRLDTSATTPIAALFDLQVKTIVLDPGHGGIDPGASSANGLQEKAVTLDVARRLQRRLERYGAFRVLLTREADTKVTLRERVRFANAQQADLFISIHLNKLPTEPVTAIETYYFGVKSDARTLLLAEAENEEGGYSVAEFNAMVERLGTTLKVQESRRLGEAIQQSLLRNIRRTNTGVADWGVKRAPFVVLLGVEAPSILAEIAVLSNPEEEARLQDESYRENLAHYLEEGVLQYLTGAIPSPEPEASTNTSE